MATKVLVPEKKFPGHSDQPGISKYFTYFELLLSLNGGSDQKSTCYLTIFLEGDAEAF